MATLADLRRKVQTRLRDFNQKDFNPAEIDILLNEAQDRITKETDCLISTVLQDVVANQALYSLAPAGYRLGRIITLKIYDGSIDIWPLLPISVAKLDQQDSDWRSTSRTNSKPWMYVRNYDPNSPLTISKDSVWLYPMPSTAYTEGLRATCTFATDSSMLADTDESVLTDRLGEEALINYAVSEALVRSVLSKTGDEVVTIMKLAAHYKSKFDYDLERAVIESRFGQERTTPHSRTFWM